MNKSNSPADMFSRFSQVPFGADLFSRAVVFKAPYFATISPKFLKLEQGRCEIFMKKRRRVTNHIGTVHAIAMCNLCELAAGTMIESTLPGNLRWIPRGMSVRYLKKAETGVTARAEMAPVADGFKGDIVVPVKVYDANNEVVMEADISMYVSPRKSAAS